MRQTLVTLPPGTGLSKCQAGSWSTSPGRRPEMSEIRIAVGDADAGLAERLDQEISAFNAAVTGYHDGRMLSVAVRGDDDGLLAGLYGWTWGGCGYVDLLWVRDDQRGHGLGARLLAT